MKRLIALALAALIVCSLTVTAFAAGSPVAPKVINTTIQKGTINGATNNAATTDGNGTITVVADPTLGTFNNWTVFKVVDGTQQAAIGDTAEIKYVTAVEGTDYVIVAGSLTSSTMTVRPLTDLVICGNYNGKVTDPKTGEDSGSTAPKTGADVAILLAVAALALAGAGFATKKVLA